MENIFQYYLKNLYKLFDVQFKKIIHSDINKQINKYRQLIHYNNNEINLNILIISHQTHSPNR